MKNTKFFEVKCSINQEEQLSIRIPYSCHEDFSRTVSGRKEKEMARLVELFGEYSLFIVDLVVGDVFIGTGWIFWDISGEVYAVRLE